MRVSRDCPWSQFCAVVTFQPRDEVIFALFVTHLCGITGYLCSIVCAYYGDEFMQYPFIYCPSWKVSLLNLHAAKLLLKVGKLSHLPLVRVRTRRSQGSQNGK